MPAKELHDIDEELRQEHLEQFGEAYPCGYVEYCDYCDIEDRENPCAKAKLRMEERNNDKANRK